MKTALTRTAVFGSFLLVILVLGLLQGCDRSAIDLEAYTAELESHRDARVERLRSPTGWLSLTGLYWLAPGDNTFGSGESNAVVLPDPTIPAVAGVLRQHDGGVRVIAEPGSGVEIGGTAVTDRELGADTDSETDILEVGRLSFYVIERDGRFGIRVRDPDSPERKAFRGIDFYPIDPDYRVNATFERFDPPREIAVATVVGVPAAMVVPGRLHFELNGQSLSLEPLLGEPGDTSGLIIFMDETSGDETYGAGRYLSVDLAAPSIVVDFNRAYNPPCVFTPYATCPLPPSANRLDAPIRAGEKDYRKPESS